MTSLVASWSVPSHISALTTSLDLGNLALHVNDDPNVVLNNRQKLREQLNLKNEPVWLNQTHSNRCVLVEEEALRDADAAITRSSEHPLVIMTADCLPILLCNDNGTEIAAIHAGWRGLLNGVIENTLVKMKSKPMFAWIGPSICNQCFEIGSEVKEAFEQHYPFLDNAFHIKNDKHHANLALIAQLILNHSGVEKVTQSNACTVEEKDRFYSYRREAQTGRIATLIWFNKEPQ